MNIETADAAYAALLELARGRGMAMGLSLLSYWGRRGPRRAASFSKGAFTAPRNPAAPPAPRRQVPVENVNIPGRARMVDAAMYRGMKAAFLKVLPATSPGLTAAEIRARLPDYLSAHLFPGAAKTGWWAKTVQLDLEAKGLVLREKTKPTRWRRG